MDVLDFDDRCLDIPLAVGGTGAICYCLLLRREEEEGKAASRQRDSRRTRSDRRFASIAKHRLDVSKEVPSLSQHILYPNPSWLRGCMS
jgi:hypothetical protein